MARPLRLEFSGALYHITSRGDGREDVYRVDRDRQLFLRVLADVCERFNWWGHAYCLMTNHYHLLMETPDANLSNGMRQLNGVLTRRFNEAHRRCGHVFQGRYNAVIVQKETHLKELARYIVLNRFEQGWSSVPKIGPGVAAARRRARRPVRNGFVGTGLLSAFAATEQVAVVSYRRFVAAGIGQPAPWEQLEHQVFLGSEEFVDNLRRRLPKDRDLSEVPRAQRRPLAKPLTEYAALYSDRSEAIVAAHASGGYTLQQIGKHFDLHYSRISRIVRRAKEAKGKTETPPPVSHTGLAAVHRTASHRSVHARPAIEPRRAPLGPARGTDDFLGLE